MTGSRTQRSGNSAAAPVVGDHLALDLLNTRARTTNGEAIEYWHSDGDVLRWLEQQGVIPAPAGAAPVDQDALLSQAKALRELAHRLIVQRKEGGEAADPCSLNEYLHAYRSAPHLERDGEGNLVLTRLACGDTPTSLLGPAAEAVAELLIEADFSLVKQCEHPECVLWFYDRTRARRRRWCSMSLCGNRQKAARFRKRAAATTPSPPIEGAQSS